ncbi:MAG: hypothetical protein ACTSXO_13085 [Candidatus Heimdallarchaeota archaeon]
MAFSWLLLFMNLLLAIWNIAPQQNIGMFTAFYYVFWNLAAILSPLLAGGFFDLIGYLTGINGLQTLFLLISAIYLVALLILFIIRCKQIKVFHKNIYDESFLEQQIISRELPIRYLLFFLFSGQQRKAEFKDLKIRQQEIKKEQKKELKNFKAEFAIIKNKIQTEARKIQRQKIREKRLL